jgi:hypothetical protein
MAHQIESPSGPKEMAWLDERRSRRSSFIVATSMKARINEVAAMFDVSANEVLIACLQFGLSDPGVVGTIQKALTTRERRSQDEEARESHHLLPPSLRERLDAISAEGTSPRPLTRIVTICLQNGLFNEQLLQIVRERAESRPRKFGRTVSKEAIHRAA